VTQSGAEAPKTGSRKCYESDRFSMLMTGLLANGASVPARISPKKSLCQSCAIGGDYDRAGCSPADWHPGSPPSPPFVGTARTKKGRIVYELVVQGKGRWAQRCPVRVGVAGNTTRLRMPESI